MTHDFKPGQLVKYVGTLNRDGRVPGDVLQLRRFIKDGGEARWRALILRNGNETTVFPPYIQPIGDQDDGNP